MILMILFSYCQEIISQVPLLGSLLGFGTHFVSKGIIEGFLWLFISIRHVYLCVFVCNSPAWYISGLGGDGWEHSIYQ